MLSSVMAVLVPTIFPNRIPRGEIALTRNIRATDLAYFTDDEAGRCSFSCDRDVLPGENAQANVRRAYAAIGVAPPADRFVSLALRTGDEGLSRTLSAYGTVVLEIDLDRVGRDLVIFNGDVKDLGHKINDQDDATWAVQVPWNNDRAAVARRLTEIFANTRTGRRPRRVGGYFEARLPRALVLADVLRIHVDPTDEVALQSARALCADDP